MYCAKCKSDITNKTKIHKSKIDKLIRFTHKYVCLNCYIKHIILIEALKN